MTAADIKPGAFCREDSAPYLRDGVEYVCSRLPGEDRPRWRRHEPEVGR